MLQGYTFDGQKFPAAPFAEFQDQMLNRNSGIDYGFDLTNTSNSITIGDGLAIIKGRAFKNVGDETIQVQSLETGQIYCKLIIEINVSEESKSSLQSLRFRIITSTTTFPLLTQQEINRDGEIYQFELAQFINTVTGITNFKDIKKYIEWQNILRQVSEDSKIIIDKIKEEYEKARDGSAYMLADRIKIGKEIPDANNMVNGDIYFQYFD